MSSICSVPKSTHYLLPTTHYAILPSSPGVYFFRDKAGKLLYIGKAINLKRRVSSYFQKNHFDPRIDAYDISNIFGEYAVGSMVVFDDGKIDKDEYRRFKIKSVKGIFDTEMLAEVLNRRLNHNEWKMPDLIIIDGGLGQLNAVKKVLENRKFKIPLISIAKGPTRKGEKMFMTKNVCLDSKRMAPNLDRKMILAARDEAHRFAILYHRKLKKGGMFN
ncbi:GIY-YIG nuclease family protein [Patescibacteria group bacterium]|nr:GIY-YIG nuclease family protein [Patescibacteria group bacterium]MBU4579793.1 GIY-YIG nuclease family protein [Patescibacteria group bacterium]